MKHEVPYDTIVEVVTSLEANTDRMLAACAKVHAEHRFIPMPDATVFTYIGYWDHRMKEMEVMVRNAVRWSAPGLSGPRRSGCCVAGLKGHHHRRTIAPELGNW